MNLLRKLLGLTAKTDDQQPIEVPFLSSGDYITQLADGANLVDGKPAWQCAETSKHDLEIMLRCCEAELETMHRAHIVAAPFYFERVAILLRKRKEFDREVEICEKYINAVERYYLSKAPSYAARGAGGGRIPPPRPIDSTTNIQLSASMVLGFQVSFHD